LVKLSYKFLTKIKVIFSKIFLIFLYQIHEKLSTKRSNLWLTRAKRKGLRPLKDYKGTIKKRPSFKRHIKKKDAARALKLTAAGCSHAWRSKKATLYTVIAKKENIVCAGQFDQGRQF
jgi:hypothetical protein